MPRYLYRTKATRPGMVTDPTPAESEVVTRHFDYLAANADDGVVLVAGRTLDSDQDTFGIVIFEALDDAAADEFMRDDPAVAEDVMTAEVFPYRVAIGGHVTEG